VSRALERIAPRRGLHRGGRPRRRHRRDEGREGRRRSPHHFLQVRRAHLRRAWRQPGHLREIRSLGGAMPLDTPKRGQADPVPALIGQTPMVEVTRLDAGPCSLFLKLENQNPGGSIKDRIGLAMVDTAERDGRLKPGGTVVEATAGNTGLGLALVARAKGYRVVLVVPDKMSTEKVLHLKALGAEVHITRSDFGKGHP